MWNGRKANQYYKSRYIVKNRSKYLGDPTKVIARSGWERAAFIWCEDNPRVKQWASENVHVPYINPIDKKQHKYIMDLMIWWTDGTISIVEIKPKHQTKPPTGKRRTKKYIAEAYEYIKNQCKWEAAGRLAKARNWRFEIWHEENMRSRGIRII